MALSKGKIIGIVIGSIVLIGGAITFIGYKKGWFSGSDDSEEDYSSDESIATDSITDVPLVAPTAKVERTGFTKTTPNGVVSEYKTTVYKIGKGSDGKDAVIIDRTSVGWKNDMLQDVDQNTGLPIVAGTGRGVIKSPIPVIPKSNVTPASVTTRG